MNQLFEYRPLLKTGILALLLLPFLYLINDLSPSPEKIPEGYSSSILAFEFVSNQKELQETIGPLSAKERSDMDKLNYVDFGFMTLYGIFLFLFMARFGSVTSGQLFAKAKWLAPLIVLFDVLENIQLLKLTNVPTDTTSVDATIMLLGVFTWFKWGLLSVVFAIIGYAMTKMNRSKWLGYVLLLPAIIGIVAFVSSKRNLEDLFGTSVFLGFFLLFIYCLVYKKLDRT